MDFYKKLKKIKRPTMILVEQRIDPRRAPNAIRMTNEWNSRIRILEPNGRCTWDDFGSDMLRTFKPGRFSLSCFCEDEEDRYLNDTVDNMKKYDKQSRLHIVAIMEL